MRFTDRVAIVTGGAGGIGLAVGHRLASEGARIVVADLDPTRSAAAADTLKAAGAPDAWGAACDVSDEAAVEACCAGALQRFGRLDVVVNNAGTMSFTAIVDTPVATFQRDLNTDLIGAFLFTKHAYARMKPGGAVVNVASVHAVETSPLVAAYAAAKAGLVSFTRTSAIEGKPLGLRANAVLPGAIDTPMLWDNPNVKSGAEVVDKAYVGKAEDVAAAIAFLASDDASFVSGASLLVDGGRLARL